MAKRIHTIPAEGSVLKWAREVRGFTRKEAARLLSITEQELAAIEDGRQEPPGTVFKKMVSVYLQVESVLLLPHPPATDPLPEDYRTVGGAPATPSPDTLLAIREARRIQRYVSELVDDDPELLPHPDIPRASVTEDPENQGLSERQRSGVTMERIRQWKPYGDAFARWRAKVQAMGILVLQTRMPWEDCRGFSLWDADSVPMIVVNSEDAFNARIFTLFHEYGHLMLRQTGTCVAATQNSTPKGRIERWCDSFAAAFLVPADDLRRAIDKRFPNLPRDGWSLWHIERLAADFRVSPYVIARRLKEQGISGFYDENYRELRQADKRKRVSQEQKGGIRAETLRLSEVGLGAASVVLEALRGQLIDAPEAVDILGLRLDQLGAFEEQTEVQKSRTRV